MPKIYIRRPPRATFNLSAPVRRPLESKYTYESAFTSSPCRTANSSPCRCHLSRLLALPETKVDSGAVANIFNCA